jgi:phosphoglycolate phosphatase-like HAD superfamily hydrolase
MSDATVLGLERLRDAGIKLVVSSNSAQHFVDEFAVRERFRFDAVLGFDAGRGMAKGRPHVEHVVGTLGVQRRELLFCGDSLKDGDLARDCGIAFIGRLGTFSHDDFRRWDPAAVAVDDVLALAGYLLARAAA